MAWRSAFLLLLLLGVVGSEQVRADDVRLACATTTAVHAAVGGFPLLSAATGGNITAPSFALAATQLGLSTLVMLHMDTASNCRPKKAWDVTLDGYLNPVSFSAGLVRGAELVFASAFSSAPVVALIVATGRRIWEYTGSASERIQATTPPAVSKFLPHSVFVGVIVESNASTIRNGTIVALDSDTGKEQWRTFLTGFEPAANFATKLGVDSVLGVVCVSAQKRVSGFRACN